MSTPAATKESGGKDAERPKGRSHEPTRASGSKGTRADMLALQRTAGNQAVVRLLGGGRNTGRDAEGPRDARPGGFGGGRPLDQATRVVMESRFGHDFGGVRIHTDDRSAASAQDLDARAYTVGRDIVFGEGGYVPGTAEGTRLLGHELAHVVQQTAGSGSRASAELAEGEAARAGGLVAAGQAASVSTSVPAGVQCDKRSKAEARREQQEQRLAEVKEGLTILAQSPEKLKALDDERKVLEIELHGETDEHLNARENREAAVRLGIAPGIAKPEDRETSEEHERRVRSQAEADQEREKREKLAENQVYAGKENKVYAPAKPSFDTKAGLKQILIKAGADVKDFQRPLSGFEMQIQDQKNVRATYQGGGALTMPMPSSSFAPLADPETGEIIGYSSTSGADLTIVDIEGNVLRQGDVPSTPSAIQPDDLLLIGGALVKVSRALLVAYGDEILAGTIKVISRRMLRPMRGVAAAFAIGTSDALPMFGGKVASHASIAAEKLIAGEVAVDMAKLPAEVASDAAKAATATPLAPIAGATEGAVDVAKLPAEVASDTAKAATATPLAPIAGATEVAMTQAEYEAALSHVFPSQALDPVMSALDRIGHAAAQRVAVDPRFLQAVQSRNWALAGTLFHSAAAQVTRGLAPGSLPPGWTFDAERTIQSGKGGSRADELLQGPSNQLGDVDWKTTGRSALSTGARREAERHARQIGTNIPGTLSIHQSKSWVDFVRPLLPGVKWPR